MMSPPARLVGAVALAMLLGQASAGAEMVSYRARYALSLASTKASSGVVGAGGIMLDEWDKTCNGWTEQEHFYLHLDYSDQEPGQDTLDTYTSFVSWEAEDGRRFQFDLREAGTDDPFDEIAGEARLGAPGKPGTANFKRPAESVLSLPAGTLFPAAHTRLLIARAEAGDTFVTRKVFDGSDVESAYQISAVIGPKLAPALDARAAKRPESPLLDRPSWRIRLAFFPPDNTVEIPDYEESVRLLDNGVMQDMLFDYGDYAIRAKLEHIDALRPPPC
jgi:hypothetical protein